MNFLGQVYHVKWFLGQKVTRRENELDHAQNQAEPENPAGLVPGPDPEENFKFFFKKPNPPQCPITT